jgi:uncharacterized phage-associated protein
MFRQDKATAMAVYFLIYAPGHKLNDLMLMKLMVIAERECMAQSTSLITGARFVSMQNGPVLSEVLNLMSGKAGFPLWSQCVGFVPHDGPDPISNFCFLKHEFDVAEYLSEFEVEILTSVWNEHGDTDKWDIVNLTHTFPEWDWTCEGTNSSSPISLESIFRLGMHQSRAVARERAEAIEYFEAVSA